MARTDAVRVDDARFDAALRVAHRKAHACHMAVMHEDVVQERVLQHGDVRIGLHHGGNVEFQHLAGGVSPRMHHTGTAVRGFKATQHMAFPVAVHMPSVADELAYASRAFVRQYVDGGAVAQSVAGRHGVGGVQSG